MPTSSPYFPGDLNYGFTNCLQNNMFNVNLTNCDQEPIHIPGKIQGHGFLIVADRDYNITCCSENISQFLLVSPTLLLQQPLGVLERYIINPASSGFLIQLLILGTANNNFDSFNPYAIEIQHQPFNLVISLTEDGEHYLLEFEPEFSNLKSDLQRTMGRSLSEILAVADLSELLHKAATQIKNVIGYDRVMIYKFHEDGHGEVVAEEKQADLESLLGLHYPASDIPKQARELYKINLMRLISDVETEPSAIVTFNDIAQKPIDLTHSILRAVSPIHIQYLKNMGVCSSFSISLIEHGKLWGLVACHNYTPRFINCIERESAKLIGQVLSSALSFRQQEEDQFNNSRLKEAVITLGKGLIRNENIEKTLFDEPITLLNAVNATGVALYYDNNWYTEGITPDEKFLNETALWLGENMESALYESNQFSLVYPEALRHTQTASGILACMLSKELKEYMIWFRPEVISTINWAGNPEKAVSKDANGMLYISPRKSFETWRQTVRFSADNWTNDDIKSALLVREEVAFAISRKAIEIRVLNEKLKNAYDELSTFSYTISHDLKTPLTTIKSFGQLLSRNPTLDDKAQHMVSRIVLSAEKMQVMIEEVLRYSQVGQNKTFSSLVNMETLLNELKQEFLDTSDHEDLKINITSPLAVYGDQIMVMQVFSNLISNAVKYSKQAPEAIVNISCIDTGDCIQYSVNDNGIGVKTADHEKIFELFTRSEEVKEYEGTGVGLSIVKKIMEKHNGKVWLESGIQQGSTFHVSFNKPSQLSN